jgi:hypothetical protein
MEAQWRSLRAATIGDKKPGRVWVLNLLSGAERELQLRRGAAAPTALGWSEDGSAIYVRADTTVYRFVAPPASGEPRIVTDGERARAESSLEVLVGQPPFGSVVPCGSDLCVLSEQSAPAPFASNAHDPVRWGPDSVGFVSGPDLIVRPVGPDISAGSSGACTVRSARADILWRGKREMVNG